MRPLSDRAGLLRQRGFVLLVVLWTVALLALIGGHITAGARTATGRAAALRAGAMATAAADGLVHETLFHLLDPSPRHWTADGIVHQIVLARGSAEIRITNDAGRINPNFASIQALVVLLRAFGQSNAQATALATAIYEWHVAGGASQAPYIAAHLPYVPPASPFSDINELLLIPGMTPDLLARLAPHLSVYNDGRLELALAEPLVIQVIQTLEPRQRPQPAEPDAPTVLRIAVGVHLSDAAARRDVVVRIDLSAEDPSTSCEILAWR